MFSPAEILAAVKAPNALVAAQAHTVGQSRSHSTERDSQHLHVSPL